MLCERIGEEIAPLAINNFIQRHVDPDRRCTMVCDSEYIKYDPNK